MPTDHYVLSDLLYRSRALTSDVGAIEEAYDTDAYGNTLIYSAAGTGGNWWADDAVQTNDPINPFICTGRRYDPETQIYFFRARYYSPPQGRFIGRDPMKYHDGMSPYAGYFAMYGGVDPYGNYWWSPATWFLDTAHLEEGALRRAEAAEKAAAILRERGEYEKAAEMDRMAREARQEAGVISDQIQQVAHDAFARSNWDRTNGTLEGLSLNQLDIASFGYGPVDENGKSFTFDPCAREQNRCYAQCIGNLLASSGPWNITGLNLNPLGGGDLIEFPTEDDVLGAIAPSAPTIIAGVIESDAFRNSPDIPRSIKPARPKYPTPPLAPDPHKTGSLSGAGGSLLDDAGKALSVAMYFKGIKDCWDKCLKRR